MLFNFNGSLLTDTDYFGSEDHLRRIPWCWVDHGVWHLLIPPPPIHPPSMVEARPVTDSQEPDHWRWRIEIGTWCLPLYHRCILPFRPGFPARGTIFDRAAVLYTSHKPAITGTSFFGTLSPGWQITEHPLKLVRRWYPLI